MIFMRHLFFSAIMLLSLQNGLLAEDYTYFITENDGIFYVETNGTRVIDPAQIDQAKKAKDSRPAEQDPEGNWGAISNGMQASIRFDTNSFVTNDHITATVIVRNVGKEWRMFTIPVGLASCISVLNPEQKRLERKDWKDPKSNIGQLQRSSHGPNAISVDPGMQRKLNIDLQLFYDFSRAGEYCISVKMKTYPERSDDFKWVQSGDTVVAITNSLIASTNNAAPLPK